MSIPDTIKQIDSNFMRKLLPQYRSHKIVHAAKIVDILPSAKGNTIVTDLTQGDGRAVGFFVAFNWVANRKARPGGYFVLYEDGYTSFSPAEAFESGYTLAEHESPVELRNRLMREAEKAAHEYAASLDLGDEREKAFEVFENIRTAGRVY